MLKSRIPQIIVEIDIRIAEVIDRGTDQVERDAKARVPVASGKLRDAIHKDERKDGTYVLAAMMRRGTGISWSTGLFAPASAVPCPVARGEPRRYRQ